MANTLTSSLALADNIQLVKPTTGIASLTWTDGTNPARLTFNSANGPAAASGADEVYKAFLSIAASSSMTLGLSGTSIQNPVGDNIAFVRVKAIIVELISTAQDSTNGSAASSITVGGAASNPALVGAAGFIDGVAGSGGAPPTFRVFNGGWTGMAVANANGVAVANSSSDQLKITNEDGAIAAKVRITIIGSKS